MLLQLRLSFDKIFCMHAYYTHNSSLLEVFYKEFYWFLVTQVITSWEKPCYLQFSFIHLLLPHILTQPCFCSQLPVVWKVIIPLRVLKLALVTFFISDVIAKVKLTRVECFLPTQCCHGALHVGLYLDILDLDHISFRLFLLSIANAVSLIDSRFYGFRLTAEKSRLSKLGLIHQRLFGHAFRH